MVVTGREQLHVVQEEDSSKRRQILDGARKVFMDLGFDGASMGEIARAAQVSKGTLYVYFADKSALSSKPSSSRRRCSTARSCSISIPPATPRRR
ncbi:DNA-binding transcriptional regulator YbjK [Bradyrhizobium sp. LB7.1]